MARFEVHLQGPPLEEQRRHAMAAELAGAIDSQPTWLDANNASLPVVLQPQGLTIQVLLEFRSRGQLIVLVNSREGMGHGAPLTRRVVEQLLNRASQLLPDGHELYRSDRDGPIRRSALQPL